MKKGLDDKVKQLIIKTLKDMAKSGKAAMYFPSDEEYWIGGQLDGTRGPQGILFKITPEKKK